MSILAELLKLRDPLSAFLAEAEAPVELKAVIDAFPKHHEKALRQLWGGKRLVWHGMPFFADGELGDAYVKAEEAAHEFLKNEEGPEVDFTYDIEGPIDSDEDFDSIDVRYNATITPRDTQECYLGYDPKRDVLYIGFDAWTDDDEFNEAWDKAFKRATGEDFDIDNDQHSKIFHDAWKKYQDERYGFWGLVYEVDRHFNCEEALPPMVGGFYKGTFQLFKRQHSTVVDLRLD